MEIVQIITIIVSSLLAVLLTLEAKKAVERKPETYSDTIDRKNLKPVALGAATLIPTIATAEHL